MPIKLRIACLFLGLAILLMALTFAANGWIPSCDIQLPRYSSLWAAKHDLVAFILVVPFQDFLERYLGV